MFQDSSAQKRFKGIVSRDGVSSETTDEWFRPTHFRFTLVKSRVKNIQRFKQAVSCGKMARAGFHCIAKIRTQILNPVCWLIAV
jgi:hypothetical protein